MPYARREAEKEVARAARAFAAVVLTGPRRAGKTSLLRHLYPKASYTLLEDPDVVARLRADPQGFLDGLPLPAILDEVQNTPEVFAHVRARIDRAPRKTAQWFLTGSQEAPLMQGVSESMAGRAAVLQLLPMSMRESSKVSMLRGGYPEVLARPSSASLWFSSYVQTYLERDVRDVLAIKDLALFRRFLALLASRHGQVLNKTDLSGPLGVSVPTIGSWLNVLETTQQIFLVPPYFNNVGKRLTKSPRLYIADAGLACHLLGIENAKELEKSPFLGAIFEGFVASEIVKAQLSRGKRRELYFFRDEQGLEVDFVYPGKGGSTFLVEAKASKTPVPHMAKPLTSLRAAFTKASLPTTSLLVHRAPRVPLPSQALVPGVRAVDVETFAMAL